MKESYEIQNLINDKTINGVLKIEVKWKGHRITTREPISSLKVDQPNMVKEYMKQINKKTAGKTGTTTLKQK